VGSYNDYSVLPDHDALRAKFEKSQKSFTEIYESAKIQLEQSMQPDQREYLQKALKVANKVPGDAAANGRTQPVDSDEEQAWKNCWNWNLSEAAFGNLVFEIKEGRVSAKTFSQGMSDHSRRDRKLTARYRTQLWLQTTSASASAGTCQDQPASHQQRANAQSCPSTSSILPQVRSNGPKADSHGSYAKPECSAYSTTGPDCDFLRPARTNAERNRGWKIADD
jgi:hypothetical protein